MEDHPSNRPLDSNAARISQIDLLDQLGGEPLAGSGFEAEQPDTSFEEGI